MSNLLKTALLAAGLSFAIPHASATDIPLGAASNYVVLFQSFTGKKLELADADIFSNATIEGNIGIGQGGTTASTTSHFKENNSGSSIGGKLDFEAADLGQYDGSNANVGPDSVNFGVGAVATAINDAKTLSIGLDGLQPGTVIAIGNGPLTVDASTGALHSLLGNSYRVFDLSGFSLDDGKTLTINGSATDRVVFNYNGNSNVDLKGLVALTGGLTPDQVLFNFTGTGNVTLKNNASYVGTILAPNAGKLEMDNATLVGRFFGSFYSGDAKIGTGASISPYPYDAGGGGINGAPEPSSIALLGLALAGLVAMRRRHPGQIRLAPVC